MNRGLGKKGPVLAVVTPEIDATLSRLSKAALLDIVCDLVALQSMDGGDSLTLDDLRDACNPVLRVRGDKLIP